MAALMYRLPNLNHSGGVTILNLNCNYGQATALDAGFKASQGAVIVSLDGDGENDPADLPCLLQAMEEGQYDVVAGGESRKIKVPSVS